MATTIKVNGIDRTVDVDSDTPLLWVLRDVLGMTGTKFGCGWRYCGACTVHVDGRRHSFLHQPYRQHRHFEITTIEASARRGGRQNPRRLLAVRSSMRLLPSGQIMSAAALLASNPHRRISNIDSAMAGKSAACTMSAIREAIKQAFNRTDKEAENDPRSHHSSGR